MPKKEEVEEGAPLWVLTFGDMMSLLLTFFILLFSMSTINPKKFADVMGAIQTILGAGQSPIVSPTQVTPKEVMRKLKNITDLVKEGGSKDEAVEGSRVFVETVREGLKITIGGRPIFDEGKAEIRPDALRVMKTLRNIVAGYRNKIRILGHTSGAAADRLPRSNGKWQLGHARAMAVLLYLQQQDVHPARLEAATAAQYQPAVSEGDGGPGAARQNRRVELIVTEELIPWKRLH